MNGRKREGEDLICPISLEGTPQVDTPFFRWTPMEMSSARRERLSERRATLGRDAMR